MSQHLVVNGQRHDFDPAWWNPAVERAMEALDQADLATGCEDEFFGLSEEQRHEVATAMLHAALDERV